LFSGSRATDHLFGQNLDPNLDLLEQLKDYDLSKVDGLYVAFDPHVQAEGEGKVVSPDDFKYIPEKILELRNIKDPEEKRKHIAAILKEFQGLADKGVFRLAIVPEGRSAIPLKIVLKVKYHGDGSYKARAVVLGYLSRAGVDWYSSYAPTTMMATGRVLISVAVKHGLTVSHCDIPQAFIQSDIDRPIYVRLPAGIGVRDELVSDLMRNNPGKGTVALRLVKSLYIYYYVLYVYISYYVYNFFCILSLCFYII